MCTTNVTHCSSQRLLGIVQPSDSSVLKVCQTPTNTTLRWTSLLLDKMSGPSRGTSTISTEVHSSPGYWRDLYTKLWERAKAMEAQLREEVEKRKEVENRQARDTAAASFWRQKYTGLWEVFEKLRRNSESASPSESAHGIAASINWPRNLKGETPGPEFSSSSNQRQAVYETMYNSLLRSVQQWKASLELERKNHAQETSDLRRQNQQLVEQNRALLQELRKEVRSISTSFSLTQLTYLLFCSKRPLRRCRNGVVEEVALSGHLAINRSTSTRFSRLGVQKTSKCIMGQVISSSFTFRRNKHQSTSTYAHAVLVWKKHYYQFRCCSIRYEVIITLYIASYHKSKYGHHGGSC